MRVERSGLALPTPMSNEDDPNDEMIVECESVCVGRRNAGRDVRLPSQRDAIKAGRDSAVVRAPSTWAVPRWRSNSVRSPLELDKSLYIHNANLGSHLQGQSYSGLLCCLRVSLLSEKF